LLQEMTCLLARAFATKPKNTYEKRNLFQDK